MNKLKIQSMFLGLSLADALGVPVEFESREYFVKNLGRNIYDKLWVPAEKLEDFNKSIYGKIEIVNEFTGDHFSKWSDVEIKHLLKDLFKKWSNENRIDQR